MPWIHGNTTNKSPLIVFLKVAPKERLPRISFTKFHVDLFLERAIKELFFYFVS